MPILFSNETRNYKILYTRKLTMSSAVIFATFIMGLMAGPAVSLYESSLLPSMTWSSLLKNLRFLIFFHHGRIPNPPDPSCEDPYKDTTQES